MRQSWLLTRLDMAADPFRILFRRGGGIAAGDLEGDAFVGEPALLRLEIIGEAHLARRHEEVGEKGRHHQHVQPLEAMPHGCEGLLDLYRVEFSFCRQGDEIRRSVLGARRRVGREGGAGLPERMGEQHAACHEQDDESRCRQEGDAASARKERAQIAARCFHAAVHGSIVTGSAVPFSLRFLRRRLAANNGERRSQRPI